jgi:ribosomal-protein-serine acetyltransferase
MTMLFVEVGMHRVTIRAATDNLPSRGIPERLEFKHEERIQDGAYVNDEYIDL